ncbi:MAG: hypothetical protein KTR32_41055 [Granulosicoccus sp.]|nr:hypothetical protein [Granulosicoccus sp.]
MKTTSKLSALKLNSLLATTACSMLTMSCAKELPELPVTSFPAIQTLPELPPMTSFSAPESPPVPHSRVGTGKLTTPNLTSKPVLAATASYEKVDLSLIPGESTVDKSDPALKIIANDLVSAVSFITGMSPNLITVKAPANHSQFDEFVKDAFAKKGYAINNTQALNAGKPLTTSFLINEDSANGREIIGIISINGVLVKRTYSLNNKSIYANTSYLIKGIDPRLVRGTDQIEVI